MLGTGETILRFDQTGWVLRFAAVSAALQTVETGMVNESPHVRPTILIVEDEPLLLMDAVDMVEEAGFEAVEASNADQAVEILASRGDIPIVLTDIDMPGSMDGVKLAHFVRDRWPPIEIIVVSGHRRVSAEEMPERGLFFSKPYSRHAVTAAMRRLVSYDGQPRGDLN